MAEVYLGVASGAGGFKKRVAIKRILPHLSEDKEFITMFFDEARILARFNHPHIVQIFDLGRVKSTYFLAMEFVHGLTMEKVIGLCRKKEIDFDVDVMVKIMSDTCAALDYAHNFTKPDGTPLNLVHRDVSAQNIMLNRDGVVKVLDFGIAKAVGNLTKTRPTFVKGKAMYMSPEQIEQKGALDRRSDIFSMGALLYLMTTKKRPFRGSSEFEIMVSIVNEDAKDPRLTNPKIPAELARIVSKALKKDREERYQTAQEMRQDLEKFLFSRQAMVDSQVMARFIDELAPRKRPSTGQIPQANANQASSPSTVPPPTPKAPIREVSPSAPAPEVPVSEELVPDPEVTPAVPAESTDAAEPGAPPLKPPPEADEESGSLADEGAAAIIEEEPSPLPTIDDKPLGLSEDPTPLPPLDDQPLSLSDEPTPVPEDQPFSDLASKKRFPTALVLVLLLLVGGGAGLVVLLGDDEQTPVEASATDSGEEKVLVADDEPVQPEETNPTEMVPDAGTTEALAVAQADETQEPTETEVEESADKTVSVAKKRKPRKRRNRRNRKTTAASQKETEKDENKAAGKDDNGAAEEKRREVAKTEPSATTVAKEVDPAPEKAKEAVPLPEAKVAAVAAPPPKPTYQAPDVILGRRIGGKDPEYPRIARQAKKEAIILVKINITPNGRVGKIKFLRTHSAFERTVLRALKSWRFSPHMINGRPVDTYTVYKFVFRMK